MTIALEEGIQKMNIYGDSKLVINWMAETRAQRCTELYMVLHATELKYQFQTHPFPSYIQGT